MALLPLGTRVSLQGYLPGKAPHGVVESQEGRWFVMRTDEGKAIHIRPHDVVGPNGEHYEEPLRHIPWNPPTDPSPRHGGVDFEALILDEQESDPSWWG